MTDGVILDTGPLVAFLDAGEAAHDWTVVQFQQVAGPLLTCEPVLAEAMYLLRPMRPAQEKMLEWVEHGVLVCPFVLSDEVARVKALWQKYSDVPMSLADACLVCLAETYDDHCVCTLDTDFTIYRKHGRRPIPVIMPRAD